VRLRERPLHEICTHSAGKCARRTIVIASAPSMLAAHHSQDGVTMQSKLAIKMGIVLILGVILWIPLLMVSGLIVERQSLRNGVIRDMARDAVDSQRLTGPFLIVPYTRHVATQLQDDTSHQRGVSGRLVFLPERTTISGDLTPEPHHRGIYNVMAYRAALTLAGSFALPENFGVGQAGEYEFGPAALVAGISDLRGIADLHLEWQGASLGFAPGSDLPGVASGVTATLGRLDAKGGTVEFRIPLQLKGLGSIDFLPTGRDSAVLLKAAWPNPSFSGRYQPISKIDATGFTAEWRTSLLSTNVVQLYDDCLAGPLRCDAFGNLAYGVSLFQPADLYQQLERSAKYGILFIGLTFVAFFLYEVLLRLDIHPVQYGLVGVALATFYLLLVSLSERIDFALSYAAASGACVALIGFYVSHVLRSVARGGVFTGLLAGLYAMLYVLVRAEENSLLMGSIALFVLVAAVMIGTRKVDWYRRETGIPEAPAA
jgi:inner membrane protein